MVRYNSHFDAQIQAVVRVAGLLFLFNATGGCKSTPSEDELKRRVCTQAIRWAKPRVTARFDDLGLPSSLKDVSRKASSFGEESEVTESGGTRYYAKADVEFEVCIEEFGEKRTGQWGIVSSLTVDPAMSETELNWKNGRLFLSKFPTKTTAGAMLPLLPPSDQLMPPSYPITDGSVDWNRGIVRLVETDFFKRFHRYAASEGSETARRKKSHLMKNSEIPLKSTLDRAKKEINTGVAGADFSYRKVTLPFRDVRGLFGTGKIAWTYDSTRAPVVMGTVHGG